MFVLEEASIPQLHIYENCFEHGVEKSVLHFSTRFFFQEMPPLGIYPQSPGCGRRVWLALKGSAHRVWKEKWSFYLSNQIYRCRHKYSLSAFLVWQSQLKTGKWKCLFQHVIWILPIMFSIKPAVNYTLSYIFILVSLFCKLPIQFFFFCFFFLVHHGGLLGFYLDKSQIWWYISFTFSLEKISLFLVTALTVLQKSTTCSNK